MFACIHVPNFPVAAALRVEPELRARALGIFEGKVPLEKIVAVNERASQMGIAPEMSKAQAELCSELALRSRSLLQESTTHAALLDCAQSFSPCVEDAAWDTALIDLAGMESLFGSLPEIAHAIANRMETLGVAANVAVASNPDTAMIASHGFSSVTVIPEGKEAEQLGSLPVEVLFAHQVGSIPLEPTLRKSPRVDPHENDNFDLLETLERWGIRNLRALAALPEVALSERLGQKGLYLQALARGAASRTLVPIEEPLIFEEAIEVEHPIVLLEPLAFLLNRLLEQICARLGSRALATQELRLTLELDCFFQSEDDFQKSFRRREIGNRKSTLFSRTLRLPLPMLDAKLFLKLLQLDLQAHPPGAPIVKIQLAAEPVRPRSAQGGLFQPPAPEPEKLELTLARIAGMVGESRVGALELLDTHRPEGFHVRRFANDSAGGALPLRQAQGMLSPARLGSDNSNQEKSTVTALRRFRPPLLADVTLESGYPAYVTCPKKKDVRGAVLWKAGPWRFSGDWWEREAWSRDEWDIALQNYASPNSESLALFRLVHDLLDGKWFVEGVYD
jgi:protein ImuB